MFEMSMDVYDDDLNFTKSPLVTSNDLQADLSFVISTRARQVEVSVRNCTADEKRQFEEAKDK